LQYVGASVSVFGVSRHIARAREIVVAETPTLVAFILLALPFSPVTLAFVVIQVSLPTLTVFIRTSSFLQQAKGAVAVRIMPFLVFLPLVMPFVPVGERLIAPCLIRTWLALPAATFL
jgi:hypothetical protein